MYGIVTCPSCGRPQGVNLGLKTTTCQCGKRFSIRGMKVLFSTDEARELPEALGRVRAELSGDLEEFEKAIEGLPRRGAAKRRLSTAAGKIDPRETAMEVLRSIATERGGFDLSQAEAALETQGLDASELIPVLLKEGLIYEFTQGLYKPV